MAAAKQWGTANYAKLDPLTVSMAHPDGMAALLSGGGEITAHYTSAPFQYKELAAPGIHKVLDSYAWVDQPRGVVRIPIDRAIDLLVAHPPPSRAASGVPEEPTSSRPTQSTLGVRGESPQPAATGGHP